MDNVRNWEMTVLNYSINGDLLVWGGHSSCGLELAGECIRRGCKICDLYLEFSQMICGNISYSTI